MNLSKLGRENWIEPGQISKENQSVVNKYKLEIKDIEKQLSNNSFTQSFVKDKNKSNREFLVDSTPKNILNSDSLPSIKKQTDQNIKKNNTPAISSSQRILNSSDNFSVVYERPPNRSDIIKLENELVNRVNEVFNSEQTLLDALNNNNLYQPYKDDMMFIRNKIFKQFQEVNNRINNSELNISLNEEVLDYKSVESIEDEPWMESIVKCEYLNIFVDNITTKLINMISVNSIELGNVLRKIKLTYKQSYDQLFQSYGQIRENMLINDKKLLAILNKNKYLSNIISNNEKILEDKFLKEKNEIEKSFLDEKKYLIEQIKASDFKINQLNETIHSLNNIFQTMHNTHSSNNLNSSSAVIQHNLSYENILLKLKKLEQENHILYNSNIQIDVLKNQLANYENITSSNEITIKSLENEIINLKYNLIKKDEGINALINENLLKNLEIEKLKIQIEKNQKEIENIELKELATSVLCIKCKKGLDDLSNIRSTLLDGYLDPNGVNLNNESIEYGYGNYNYNTLTNYKILLKNLKCEKFRILLPNLKGKQPHRSMDWVRKVCRSILISKLNEDVNIQSIHGNVTRFPQYVYSWFDRSITNLIVYNPVDKNNQETLLNSNSINKSIVLSDEDRWGLYYGIRTLSRENDPEGIILWSLLDEYYGDDGLAFIFHCISTVLSLSGLELFNQFGYDVMYNNANISVFNQNDLSAVNRHVWLEVSIAKEATKLILIKALSSHLAEVIDAIDAFTVIPNDNSDQPGEDASTRPTTTATNDETSSTRPVTSYSVDLNVIPENTSLAYQTTTPTHIDLYLWLRLMLQQLHAEQIQRSAAVKLMFETASIGSLLPDDPSIDSSTGNLKSDGHIEYPQFQSICRSLFTNMPVVEIATLYTQCYSNKTYNKNTKRKVNADIFLKVACSQGLFARYLKLSILPIYTRYKELLDINKEIDKSIVSLDDLPKDTNNHYLMNLSTEVNIRAKLGSIIHIHLATLRTDIKQIISKLPEKFKNLVIEALDQVNSSIDNYYVKHKRKVISKSRSEKEFKTDDENSSPIITHRNKLDYNLTKYGYIDGLQPYVYYRRLLSLLSFVKSLTDSPLLPPDIFFNYSYPKVLSTYPINTGLQQVNQLLTSLEETIIMNKYGNQKSKSKWYKFNQLKRNISIRKIQSIIRKFVNFDVAVPRSIRTYMRSGYLYGVSTYKTKKDEKRINLNNSTLIPIHKRTNLLDTYVVQSILVEIYYYKIHSDKKLQSMNLSNISLSQCIADYMYTACGSIEVAERLIHDFLFSINIYKVDNYRIKLFRIFIGEINKLYNEIDDNLVVYLQSHEAFSVYLSLLTVIRKQILNNINQSNNPISLRSKGASSKKKENMMRLASHASNNSGSSGGNDAHSDMFLSEINNSNTEIDSTSVDTAIHSPSLHTQSISYNAASRLLYHSSVNPITKVDSKDVWYESIDTISQAISKWSKQQKGLEIYTNVNIYTQLIEQLTVYNENELDVDEVIYMVMIQWAKLMNWFVKKSTQKIQSINRKNEKIDSKDHFTEMKVDNKVDIYSSPIYVQNVNQNYLIDLFDSLYQIPSLMSITSDMPSYNSDNLNEDDNIITLSDSSYYTSKYLAIYISKSKSIQDIDKYIRQCILWDLNIGFDKNIFDSTFISPNSSPLRQHSPNPSSYPNIRSHNRRTGQQMSVQTQNAIHNNTTENSKDVISISPVLLIATVKSIFCNYVDTYYECLDKIENICTTQGDKDEDMSQRTFLYSIRRLINELITQLNNDLSSSTAIPQITATTEDTLDLYNHKSKDSWDKFRFINRAIDDLTAKYNLTFPNDKYYQENKLSDQE